MLVVVQEDEGVPASAPHDRAQPEAQNAIPGVVSLFVLIIILTLVVDYWGWTGDGKPANLVEDRASGFFEDRTSGFLRTGYPAFLSIADGFWLFCC